MRIIIFTETQKSQTSARVQEIINNTQPTKQADKSIDISFVNNLGANTEISARASVDDSSGFFNQIVRKVCTECQTTEPDADIDGLPDSFENNLANGFTPFYYVSGGENAGTGFARFNNSVPQTVSQVFGSTPPISHFRVKPLGFFNRNDGIQYGLIQIDYLTLWNKDDGLAGGSGLCILNPLVVPLELTSHNLDNERSALLVAAPLSNSTYNLNLQNYKLYEVCTAAHEGTFFDQSRYYNLTTPYPIDSHIKLALSRSKHGTYAFNPNLVRLFPQYVIYGTYSDINFLYSNGIINYYEYLAYLFVADQTFLYCIVERFQDQGGVFANTRINIGELNQPLNGSNFIKDTELTNKLNRLFY